MKVHALFCIAVLAITGVTAQAQESSDSDEAKQGLTTLLEAANGSSLRGNVEISKEKAPEQGNGNQNIPGLGRVRVQMGLGGTNLLTGSLEVFVAEGAISATTASELSQVKLYKNGHQQLISQMYSKSPKNIGKATDLMAHAFDFDTLIEEVGNAKLVRVKDVEGGKQFRVTLDGEAFESEQEPGARRVIVLGNNPSVLEGVLVVNANSDGELERLSLELQYNDPMAGLLNLGGAQPGINGGAMQLNLNAMKKSNKPGDRLTVVFTPNEEQGQTAEAFAAEARELLEAAAK